jgi:hypothetical protein
VFGLESLQIEDGLAFEAAGVIDAALEAGLGVGSVVEGLAGGAVGAGIVGVFDGVDEEFGIDPVEAAEAPGVADDVIDQEAFDVGLGLATVVETCGEGGEIGDIFAGDDGGFGVDAGFDGVHAGSGFAFGSARPCGVLCVATVSVDLTLCCHFYIL